MEVLRAAGSVLVLVLVLAGIEVQGADPRAPTSPREDEDPTARRYHRVEHGSCTYTFVLPDLDNCRAGQSRAASRQDALGRPAGSTVERLGRLEAAAKNNTAWLQKVCLALTVALDYGARSPSLSNVVSKCQLDGPRKYAAVVLTRAFHRYMLYLVHNSETPLKYPNWCTTCSTD